MIFFKLVNIWQSHKQARGCRMHFRRLLAVYWPGVQRAPDWPICRYAVLNYLSRHLEEWERPVITLLIMQVLSRHAALPLKCCFAVAFMRVCAAFAITGWVVRETIILIMPRHCTEIKLNARTCGKPLLSICIVNYICRENVQLPVLHIANPA